MSANIMSLRRPLAAAIAAAAAGGTVCGLAQDIRVEVTGTNIRRIEGESALPVTVIDREEIDRTGARSAAELMQYVSANTSGGAVSVNSVLGAVTYGVQTASLRGLGGQNTLVLLNGKRLSATAGEGLGVYGVNLDSIPFSAIERVEVLRDGASAVYGSDAIAGVVNFITRQDFSGAVVTLYGGWPTRGGGGEKYSGTVAVGWGDLVKDRFNVFASGYYQNGRPLDQNKRNFSRSGVYVDEGVAAISGNTFPAHISTARDPDSPQLGTPGFPDCAPGIYAPALDPLFGQARCVFDPAAADGVNAIPQQQTWSFFGSGRWQFHPDWQLYGTAAYTKVDTRSRIQPAPLSDQFYYGPAGDIPATFTLLPSSPYYPTALADAGGLGGEPLNLRYRTYPLGLRVTTDDNVGWQTVAGVKGTAWHWDFDLDFVYGRDETREVLNDGFARYSQLLPLLNSGRVNPFGPSTPEVQAEIDALQFRETTFRSQSTGWLVEGKASGDLLKLPAGSLAAAFGFQAGTQELEQQFQRDYRGGDVTGYGGTSSDISADRNRWAAFAEFVVPIVRNLDFNAAVRYDDYGAFGSTTNPKLSIRWNPVRQLLLRGAWGTGFVAPALTQDFGANTTGLSEPGLSDPLRCPTTRDTNDCLTQFDVVFGGNRELQPQKSTQWTLGFVFEPVPRVSLALDWFNLDVTDMLSGGPPVAAIVNDQARYGHLITRGPVQPEYPDLPGPITRIDQRFTNIGRVKIEGFDVDIRAESPPTALGRFSFNLDGTYYSKYDVRQIDGTYAGFVSNQLFAPTPGVIPRYKQYATITWTYGSWSSTLGNQYQSSYVDVGLDGNGNPRRVGTLSLWNLYFTYSGLKSWKFALGVQNLLDSDPPFTNQFTTFQVGYDPTYYDARARFVYGSVTYSFN